MYTSNNNQGKTKCCLLFDNQGNEIYFCAYVCIYLFRFRWVGATDKQIPNEIMREDRKNTSAREREKKKKKETKYLRMRTLFSFICEWEIMFYHAHWCYFHWHAIVLSYFLMLLLELFFFSSKNTRQFKWILCISFLFEYFLGVYRRNPKDIQQMPISQSASNNSKQPLPNGTDTGRSSSGRLLRK